MAVTRLSVWCALACKQELFQRFLGVATEAAAIEAVRARCGVQSRSEFDKDPAAKARLDAEIRYPFSKFTHNEG